MSHRRSQIRKRLWKRAGNKNVLVAYFSWSGNTEEMAAYIAEQTGGDLLEIQPATPYPTDYDACGEVALAERDSNARPAIADPPATLDEYDVIFIGYPIWWHTAPMIVGTFLESYDLEGKAVYPFTQSASMDEEQFGNSMDFVRQSAGGAAVHDGLLARPADTQAIDEYLAASGLARVGRRSRTNGRSKPPASIEKTCILEAIPRR